MSFSAIYPVLCVDDPIKAAESFTKAFGLRPVFKENWYVHLKSESHQIGFVSDKHESIPIEIGYKSQGNFITIDSNDVNESWKKLKDEFEVLVPIKNEPWGQRHFICRLYDGVVVDVVQFTNETKADD
jgi:hypothetical protein